MTILLKPRDYGLTRVAGGIRPSLFFHADQIPGANGATPAAFPALDRGILNSSQVALPTIDTAGWNSQRSLNFASNKQLQIDPAAASFADCNTGVCLILALICGFANGTFMAAVSGTTLSRGWYYYISSNLGTLYLDPDSTTATAQSSTTMAAHANTPCILGFSRINGAWTLKVLTNSGETSYKSDTAFVKTGATTLTRASIGAQPTEGSTSAYTAYLGGQMRAGALFFGDVPSTQVSNLMVHFRDRLGCAL